MQHIIAVSGGVKIKGRAPRFSDFIAPEKRKTSAKEKDAELLAFFIAAQKKLEKNE